MKEHIELNHVSTTKVFRHTFLKADTAEVSDKFKCFQCASDYSTPWELNRHVESVHYEEYYSCSECSESFSRKDHLTRHENFVHRKCTFSCELCGKEFQRKDILLRHKKIHRSEGNRMQCALCGSSFMHKFHLTRHSKGIYNRELLVNYSKSALN